MSDEPTSTNPAKQVIGQLTQLWGASPKRRKLVSMAVGAAVLAAIGWIVLHKPAASWAPVGDGISPDSAQELYAALIARDIPARLRAGAIEVPSERVSEARAVAAASGLPRGADGLEIFDHTNLGDSDRVEQIKYRRALQGELSRSIVSLTQVEGARVHLAFGKRSVFKEESEPPSASAVLRLHAGQALTGEQVRGVRQLIAASVEGLKADGVVIIDNHGNLLDDGAGQGADPKADIERQVTAQVRAMLERVVGVGHVSVVATAEVDKRKVSETQEIYDKDGAVLRSESRTVDGVDPQSQAALAGGIAGTQGNLPGAPGAGGQQAQNPGHLQETRNFEISRTVRQTEHPDSALNRLHVAVLVDQKVDDKGKPVARSAAELAELTAIATQAAGIDATRGDVLELRAIPFAADPDAGAGDGPIVAPGPPWWLRYAIGGGLGLVGLVVFAIVMKRKKQHARRELAPTLALPAPIAVLERALEAAAAPPEAAAPALPDGGKTVHERVITAARGDIERTAHILTSWLAEPAPAPAKAAK